MKQLVSPLSCLLLTASAFAAGPAPAASPASPTTPNTGGAAYNVNSPATTAAAPTGDGSDAHSDLV